jgi:hypothetical protein
VRFCTGPRHTYISQGSSGRFRSYDGHRQDKAVYGRYTTGINDLVCSGRFGHRCPETTLVLLLELPIQSMQVHVEFTNNKPPDTVTLCTKPHYEVE